MLNGQNTNIPDSLRTNATVQQEQPVVLKQGSEYKPSTVKEKLEQQKAEAANTQKPNVQKSKDNGKSLPPLPVLCGVLAILIIGVLVFVYAVPSIKGDSSDELPEDTELVEEYVFEYSMSDKEMLREAGYTADEIEYYESIQEDAIILYDQAVEAKEAWAEQFIAPYYDTASDEYKEQMGNTFLSSTKLEDESIMQYSYGDYWWKTEKLNLDYEKVGIYGNQCWIKVYMDVDHTTYNFMYLSPDKYYSLTSNGNIIVSVKKYYTNESDYNYDENYIIVSMTQEEL